METGFANSHDGDHLSVLSHLYDQGMLQDSESLLDIMQDDFSFTSLASSQLLDSHSLWDHNASDEADLRVPFSVDSHHTDVLKEDFQKMLSDWQEHLGTLQTSDSEEMDVKDLVGLDMHMPKNVPMEIPSDIFVDSPCELKMCVGKIPENSKDRIFGGLTMNFNENLNTFNLENFLEDDDEEEHKFGLIVAEEEDRRERVVAADSSAKRPPLEPVAPARSSSVDPPTVSLKEEPEEEAVDVETVVDQIPVLEAGDLKSLLEQFEASEAFNSTVAPSPVTPLANANPEHAAGAASSAAAAPVSPAALPSSSSPLRKRADQPSGVRPPVPSPVSTGTSTPVEPNRTSLHETIRDSLPQEVIDRIKASNRRKPISVIPAMPSRRPGRGATRMQVAAATLNRNKLLKLVSSGTKGGESIQLDHDYCSFAASPPPEVAPPKLFYHSNASEYVNEQSQRSPGSSKDSEDSSCAKSVLGDNKVYSRLPEYYVVLAPQKALDKSKKGTTKEEMWDKNSRKDSGLESGEVSDASEDTTGAPVVAGLRDVASTSNSCLVKAEDRKSAKHIVPSSPEKGVAVKGSHDKVELPDRKKTTVVQRTESSQSISKDWSALCQSNGKSKPVAMVSVLKKNNIGSGTNTVGRQQSLLISSNTKVNCLVNNVNSNSSNTSDCSSTSSQTSVESEGPKKRKLNLEEYRSRLKELDRTRVKQEPLEPKKVSVMVSTCTTNTSQLEEVSTEPKVIKKEEVGAEAVSRVPQVTTEDEKAQRPVMLSVEVQTQTSIFDGVTEESHKAKDRRSRKKQRSKPCVSERASSSSSCHSTSSSGSRRHRHSRSQLRRRTSRRRSHGGHSVSSSGSQRPRSRSNSSRSSSSYTSYSSRSRSRSRSMSSAQRSPSCRSSRSSYSYQHRYGHRRPLPYSTGWRRSRSPAYAPRKNDWMLSEREKQRQVEERRVIYVGRIDEGTSKAELRRRFEQFGPIIDISVHFREHGDNYGFVTFAYKVDAYEAVEHGNDDPNLPRYDLCFGGRRAFCKTRYADLDGLATSDGSTPSSGHMRSSSFNRRVEPKAENFDLLLREAQAKLRQRKV